MRLRDFLFLFLLASCAELEPPAPSDEEILDGPLEGLSHAENLRFIQGDVAFNDNIFTVQNGLGPLFVATSCGSCHPGDGKGHPFTTLTRFGQSDASGNTYLHLGGPQLQNRAIPGFTPETVPAGTAFTKLTPPANTGLGYLDAVPDADILALADPGDANGDGISGIPNWVEMKGYLRERPNSISQNNRYIGRFGKKAAAYDLLQQTSGAYNQDIGVMSAYEPYDTYTGLEMEPEISSETIQNVVFYLKTLKAPVPRADQPGVAEGRTIFMNIGCASCHHPEFKTGSSDIAALSNKVFSPYTDLLLHDMGPGLNDGYTEGSALSSEWRTPPLWGLGLSKNSQGGSYYLLHDGRASSIDQAILLHGGEGEAAKEKFRGLTESERKALIQFLESL